jgi:hypothetical protein
MDVGTFIGVMLALFFGGLGIAYGGYSVHTDQPLIAVLSYVFGGGCIAASIVLTFLRIDRYEAKRTVDAQSQRNTQPMPSIENVAPVPARDPSNDRIFVDRTPHDLVGPFDTYVSVQAKRLIQPYIGKWIRITSEVGNVRDLPSDQWQVLVSERVDGRTLVISLSFNKEWGDRLSILTRGATIEVIGRIDRIEAATLYLENCELVA